MKFATLDHIHNLLIADVHITTRAHESARANYLQAEKTGASNLEELKKISKSTRERYNRAVEALEDFEKNQF